MAANTPKSEEHPEGAAPAEASSASEPASGVAGWLPLVAALAVMPIVAYAVTTFVLVPKLRKGLGVAPAAEVQAATEHKAEPSGEGHSSGAATGSENAVVLAKLLVNVSGTMGSRYLQTSVTLSGSAPNFKQLLEKNDARLRDTACGLLSTKTIADLEKPGARNLIRSELLSSFNHILGGAVVQEIFITEFAIQ